MAIFHAFYVMSVLTHSSSAQDFLKKQANTTEPLHVGHQGLAWPLPEVGTIELSAVHVLHCKHRINHDDRGLELKGMEAIHHEHCVAQLTPVEAYLNATRLVVPAPVCHALFPPGETSTIDVEKLGAAYASTDAHDVNETLDPVMAWRVLTGRNFGKLIQKEHEGTLTTVEQEYMDAWLSPAVVGQAAVALACDRQDPSITSAWLRGPKQVEVLVYF